jgi:FkbM family methyltransferase
MPEGFLDQFLSAVAESMYEVHTDNVDYHRFPGARPRAGHGLVVRCKEQVIRLAHRAGFCHIGAQPPQAVAEAMANVIQRADRFERLYSQLGDDYSRRMLVAVLAFRTLGSRRVKLPLNKPEYWDCIREIETQFRREHHTAPAGSLGHLDDYDLSPAGFPIKIRAHLINILNSFILEQYRYAQGDCQVEVTAGDIVIDGGGCWGDTALYLAHRAGRDGKVYCLEFVPSNLEILQQNLDRNPDLRSRVEIVRNALWNESEQELSFTDNGPGSSVSQMGETAIHVHTKSIDDLVQEHTLPKVDFIKLDVEGAELRTLHGAERTLRDFRPRLAVSVYHSLDDFWRIHEYLDALQLGYDFYLDHFTIHAEETVLFATPRATGQHGRAR